MALTRSRISLVSLALVSGLAFTACGSSSDQDAGTSASASDPASTSASASSSSSAASSDGASATASASEEPSDVAETVTDEAKQQLPGFVTSYFDTMRGSTQQQLSENTQNLLNKIQGDSSSTTSDIIDSIDKNLSDDEKQSIVDEMKNGADPMYKMVDHEGLSPAQDIVLSMFMISQSTTLFQQTATMDDSQVKVTVDADQVTYDGSTANVPPEAMTTALRESAMATATAEPSMDDATRTANSLPLVWTNNGWKLDGKTYFDNQAQ